MATPDFARILGRPVRRAAALAQPFAGHGSDVWRVWDGERTVIVRRSRESPPGRNAFFQGLHRLFGIAPWDAAAVADVYRLMTPWAAVPGCLRCLPPYLVVEDLPGAAPASFHGLGAALGARLGHLHTRRFAAWGHPVRAPRLPLAEFHPRLAEVMRELADRCWPRHQALHRVLPAVLREAHTLPPPAEACLVMADIDAGQFLVDRRGRLLGPVDLEAYVLAPPALELACLEYQLGAEDARAFAAAYAVRRPLPRLGPFRRVYRMFHYLIRFLLRGPELLGWSRQPAVFP